MNNGSQYINIEPTGLCHPKFAGVFHYFVPTLNPFAKIVGQVLQLHQVRIKTNNFLGLTTPFIRFSDSRLKLWIDSVFKAMWGMWPNEFPLQGFMPAFNLSVRLWIERRGPEMAHATESDVFLEVTRNELGAIVRYYTRARSRDSLTGAPDDQFNILLLHGFTDFPMQDIASIAVKNRRQAEERSSNVHVGDVQHASADEVVKAAKSLFPSSTLYLTSDPSTKPRILSSGHDD